MSTDGSRTAWFVGGLTGGSPRRWTRRCAASGGLGWHGGAVRQIEVPLGLEPSSRFHQSLILTPIGSDGSG